MKKFVSLLLLLCIAGTLGIPSQKADAASSFSDVNSNNTYYDAVSYLSQKGIIQGNPDGTFKPYNTLNRAEFVTIVVRHLSDRNEYQGACILNNTVFPDVGRNQWYASNLCFAYKNGLINGYPDGTFRPNDPISFVEAAKIMSTSGIAPYAGNNNTPSPWYENFVETLEANNAIPTSITSLDKKIYRGEIAEILYRLVAESYTGAQHKPSLTYEQVAGLPDPQHTYTNTEYGFSFSIPDDLRNIQGSVSQEFPLSNDFGTVTTYHFSIPGKSYNPLLFSLYLIPNPQLAEFQNYINEIESCNDDCGPSYIPEFLLTLDGYTIYKNNTLIPRDDDPTSVPDSIFHWASTHRIDQIIRDTIRSTNTTIPSDAFTLTSSNEKLEIVDDTGGGYCEGDRLYSGTYKISIGSSTLNIGDQTFLGGGKNVCNNSTNEEQRKVHTISMDNGKIYGFVYSQSYKASKVTTVVYDPQNKTLKQVKFYDKNGKLYDKNLTDPNDTGVYYSDYSKAVKKDQYITFHTYPCCGSAGFYGEEYFQPADNDPSLLIFRKFTTGANRDDAALEDGGIIEEAEPQDAGLATVYRFYKALRYANGEKAVQEVIPEKRETGAYKSADISSTYNSWNMAVALRLTELKKVDSTTVSVSYHYATDARTCEDKATVTLRQDGDKFFIEKIVPEKGC